MNPLSSRGALAEARALHDDLAAALIDGLAEAGLNRDLDPETLVIAEELARVPWSMGPHQRRSLALLVVAILLVTRAGSTRLPIGGGSSGFLGRLIRDLATSAKVQLGVLATLSDIRDLCAARSLDRIVGGKDERLPLIYDQGCLYLHRHFTSESRLIKRLRKLSRSTPIHTGDALANAIEAIRTLPSYRNNDRNSSADKPKPIELSLEQLDAVRLGCAGPLAVISGGPGTGKTSIVVAMLRVLVRLGIDPAQIALAAPTGKAAQRLSESIRANLAQVLTPSDSDKQLQNNINNATTVHRLLRFSPRSSRFGYHHNRPLPAQVLIVDEASMLDLELMDALVAAIGPETSLIFLGDSDQLPSVEAGAVLREMVLAGASAPLPEGRPFATQLTHSYRMNIDNPSGRAILGAAQAIRRGLTKGLTGSNGLFRTCQATSELEERGAELCELKLATEATALSRWWHKKMRHSEPEFHQLSGRVYTVHDTANQSVKPNKQSANHTSAASGGEFSAEANVCIERLFAVYESARLLTATRRGENGCESINRLLHRELIATTALSGQTAFYPGEPVLIRRNDYQRDLFNGEHGIILRVADNLENKSTNQPSGTHKRKEHQFRAVFRGRGSGFRSFALDSLRGSIELAFAITVHQSQGSEADSIALILPTSAQPLLTRELIYTAITRARQWALICGSKSVLRTAVSRSTERFSGIAQGLGQLF